MKLNIISNNIYFLIQIVTESDNDATTVLKDVLRSFCLNVCEVVYRLFSFFYQLFIVASQVDPIRAEAIKDITNRIMLLLGIIMLFVSIFNLIKLLLDPDKINDKEMGVGGLIKRMVTVVLLIGFTPLIFRVAKEFQTAIVTDNVIPKIIIGATVKNENNDLQFYGKSLELEVFSAFFRDSENLMDGSEKCSKEDHELIKTEILEDGTLDYAHTCVNIKGTGIHPYQDDIHPRIYAIEYDEILSVVIGVIMLWMMIVYTLNVGVRSIQLAFLELISPIPIISYIVPKKDGMFNKWVKQVITTYVDLFIRIAIIYFVLFVSTELWKNDLTFYTDKITGISDNVIKWTKIILTLALFLFARRLPQILQELTGKPSAASIRFGLGGSNSAAGLLMGATTMAGMNIAAGRGIRGAASGLLKGAWNGTAQGNYSQNMDRAINKQRGDNRLWNELRAEGESGLGIRRAFIAARAGGLTNRDWDEIAVMQDEDLANAIKKDDKYKFYKDMTDHMDATGTNTYSDLSSGRHFTRYIDNNNHQWFYESDADGNAILHDDGNGRMVSNRFDFTDYTENDVWGNRDGKHGNVEAARRIVNRTSRRAGRHYDGANASGTHAAWNSSMKMRAANKPPRRMPGPRRPG